MDQVKYGKEPLKNLKGCGLPKAYHIRSNFLKAVFHNFFGPFLNTLSHIVNTGSKCSSA